nr:MAG TPA: hypothetical protein [Caudoviricetes sp.]
MQVCVSQRFIKTTLGDSFAVKLRIFTVYKESAITLHDHKIVHKTN